MKTEEFEKLLSDLETEASLIKYDFEIAEMIGKILDSHKENLTSEQEEKLKWEYLLFRLTTKNSFAADGLRVERFVPMMKYTNGAVFPDPDTFPDSALDYFEERSKTAKNPILKARYLDILWEKSKSKQKYLFAVAATEQYLLTVNEYQNEDAIFERLDGLQRATELCLILESKKQSKPLTKRVVAALNNQIDQTDQQKKYRWFIDLFELVAVLSDSYSQTHIKKYMSLCDEAAKFYHTDQNFHLQRSFLGIKSKLVKLLTEPGDTKNEIDEAIGQSYLDEAEAKSGSGLVKVHFLQEAIAHYLKLGNKQKVNELIAQVKSATTEAIQNKEFKEFSSTVELKKEDAEKMKASLGEGKDVPQNMGTPPNFFPNWYHSIQLTQKLSKKYIAQHLFPTVHYGEQYPVRQPQTKEEIEEDNVMHNFKIEAGLANHWLTLFLNELIREKKVKFVDFKKFFSLMKTIDADTYETVLEGVREYFKDDHFKAAYILTLQLEDFLRQLLAVLGGQTTIVEAGGFREKTLGSVLDELKEHISDPVYYYISWVMEDFRGFNLRNSIAHGFFKKKNGSPRYSTAVLHIFCLLIANTKISVKKK